MMKNNEIKNDEIGSIGIGAMIVFIALILVAAVASAVIIQTGEKLQQNAQQTGSETQQEISGKISVSSVFVWDDADSYLVYFETAPGSEILDETTVRYQMTCETTGGAYQYVPGDFTAATEFDGGALTNNLEPGVSYSLVMAAAPGDDCSATSVGINSKVTLWIHVENGGSTFETLSVTDTTRGAQVI
jgi:archaeal flagellin FlaB